MTPHGGDQFTDQERARLRALLDRAEITETIYRYCRGIDRGDENLTRSTYQPDAIDAHGPFHGLGQDFAAICAERIPAERLGVQHLVGNISIDLHGDVAQVESYFIASFRSRDQPEIVSQLGGRYLDRFERRDGGPWLVARRTVVKDWSLSDRIAADLSPSVRGYPQGRFDRDDPQYRAETFAPVTEPRATEL